MKLVTKTYGLGSVAGSVLLAVLGTVVACGSDDDSSSDDGGNSAGGSSAGGSSTGGGSGGGSSGGGSSTGGSSTGGSSTGGSSASGAGGTGTGGSAGESGEATTGAGGDPNDIEPLYLFAVSVNDDTGPLEYAILREEVDFDIDVDDLEDAREFPGNTELTVIDRHVIAGDGMAPFATRWHVTEDLQWEQVGDNLNLGDYVSAGGLSFYYQAIHGNDVYLFYGAGRTSRVHWSVTDWEIVEDHEDTDLPPPAAGYVVENAGNSTQMRDFVGPVIWPFTWSVEDTGLAEVSYLAVYDTTTHEEAETIQVPCPNLQQGSIDELGRIYFSTTWNDVTPALYGDGAPNCVVRVGPDGTLDEEFGTQDLVDWTGSYGLNFRYVGNGKALANVVHPERIEGADFEGDFDPAVQCQITECEEDPDAFDPGVWELHLIDMAAGTSEIVTGFDAEHDVRTHTITHLVDGRLYIAVQSEEDVTYSTVYELDSATATVNEVGTVAGDLRQVRRVR